MTEIYKIQDEWNENLLIQISGNFFNHQHKMLYNYNFFNNRKANAYKRLIKSSLCSPFVQIRKIILNDMIEALIAI